MRIAVSAHAADSSARMEARFGRASWFVVFDSDSGSYAPVDNGQAAGLARGAGTKAAQTVINADADVVITGHCGPKAFRALTAAGVKVILQSDGLVRDLVTKYRRGELTPATGPDVDGHW